MTLQQYKKRLANHDWFYVMSGDRRAYEAGLAEENELKRLAKLDKLYQKAYDSKVKTVFSSK